MIALTIDASVRSRWDAGPALTICCVELRGAPVTSPLFQQECDAVIAQLRATGKAVFEESSMQRLRATFRAMPDMDPSRYRPACESLIRRCLDKGFFRIHPLVDLNNMLSIQFRSPLGIYDLGRLTSRAWTYRFGRTGEKYMTLAQQEKNAEGKLVLADDEGIFGSPVADAGRAPISPESREIAIVAYLPIGVDRELAGALPGQIQDAFARHFHAVAGYRQTIGG